jgi:hypothetical protein
VYRCKVFAVQLSRWDFSDKPLTEGGAALDNKPSVLGGLSRIEVTEFDYNTMKRYSIMAWWWWWWSSAPTAMFTLVVYTYLHRVLEYIYTDRPALDWLCAVDVLRAADIYGLDRLKQMCEDLIVQVGRCRDDIPPQCHPPPPPPPQERLRRVAGSLTTDANGGGDQGVELDNVGYLLELADFHNAAQLGRACVDFLCRRHAGNFAEIEASPQLEALLQTCPRYREQIERACRAFTPAQPDDKSSSGDACAGPEPMSVEM